MEKPIPYTKGFVGFYSALVIPDLPMLSFSLFQTITGMRHFLCAYCVRDDYAYCLGKRVPSGSIFKFCFLFLSYFIGCLRPNRKCVAFGEKIIIICSNYCFHVITSTDIYAGRTFVNLLVSY